MNYSQTKTNDYPPRTISQHKDNWAITKPKSTPQTVFPDQVNVEELVRENRRLHYLANIASDLTTRAEEQQQYETRLKININQITNLEQKLERVRNLVADNQIKKLQTLAKKGEI